MKLIIAILLLTIGAFAQNTKYPICNFVYDDDGLLYEMIKNGKCIELNDYNDTTALYQIKNGRMHGEVIHRINDAEFTSVYKNGHKVYNRYHFALSVPSDVYEYKFIYIDSIGSLYSSDNGLLLAEFGYYKGKVIVDVGYTLSEDKTLYISNVGINSDAYKIYYKSYIFSYDGNNENLVQIFDYSKCNVINYKYGNIISIRSMNIASMGCH